MEAALRRGSRFLCTAWIGAALLAAPAFCTTWIVDASNGPGTNFTDIPPALAAAAPGDVIIVRAGSYSGFTLNRGITLLGSPGAQTLNHIVINSVPAGEIAVLSGLAPVVSNWSYKVAVQVCTGTVLLQQVNGLFELSSSEVRLLRCSNTGIADSSTGVRVSIGRVQIVQSSLAGMNGYSVSCSPGDPGGHAIECFGVTRLHVALSTVYGGSGGNGDLNCGYWGGVGGTGLLIHTPSPLAILSRTSFVAGSGGWPGAGPGDSMVVSSSTTAWSSNNTFQPQPVVNANGVLNFMPVAAPTLELIGTPAPGATITLRLRAEPGAAARLNVGSTPVVQPTPNVLVERLVVAQRSIDLGTVPPSGLIDTPWQYRQATPRGNLVIFQANLVDPANSQVQRSNSIEAIVP